MAEIEARRLEQDEGELERAESAEPAQTQTKGLSASPESETDSVAKSPASDEDVSQVCIAVFQDRRKERNLTICFWQDRENIDEDRADSAEPSIAVKVDSPLLHNAGPSS
jgi:hypothetical protein